MLRERNGSDILFRSQEEETLLEFLSMPLHSSQPVFERFGSLPGAIYCGDPLWPEKRFIYIPGWRDDRAVLVAHADTVFTEDATNGKAVSIEREGDFLYGSDSALGADDRAGCAILWLMRDSGHSLLITDGEEQGLLGSSWLMENCPAIADELNGHSFMIQLDRRNGRDFKTYSVGTDAFKRFVAKSTGYDDAGGDSFTDICVLCRDICGVNLSVGYYGEHSEQECLNVKEWAATLDTVTAMMCRPVKRFPL